MNNKSPLLKYKLAFGIVGVFVLVVLGIVLVQAGATKADTKTSQAADRVGQKLDDYITDHNRIPASLAQAGIKDVPDTVKYSATKTTYRLCVTYKAASSDFSPENVPYEVTSPQPDNHYYDDYYSDSNYTPSYYEQSYTHKKGENCQTVKPYLYDNYNTSSGSSSTSSMMKCDPQTTSTGAEICSYTGTAGTCTALVEPGTAQTDPPACDDATSTSNDQLMVN